MHLSLRCMRASTHDIPWSPKDRSVDALQRQDRYRLIVNVVVIREETIDETVKNLPGIREISSTSSVRNGPELLQKGQVLSSLACGALQYMLQTHTAEYEMVSSTSRPMGDTPWDLDEWKALP